jgi:transcriptional regulator with XRE-family HTH domain
MIEREKSMVKRICDSRGIRYGWVATQIGVSFPQFTHIEAGNRKAPPGYYERIARVLQVPIELIIPDRYVEDAVPA